MNAEEKRALKSLLAASYRAMLVAEPAGHHRTKRCEGAAPCLYCALRAAIAAAAPGYKVPARDWD